MKDREPTSTKEMQSQLQSDYMEIPRVFSENDQALIASDVEAEMEA